MQKLLLTFRVRHELTWDQPLGQNTPRPYRFVLAEGGGHFAPKRSLRLPSAVPKSAADRKTSQGACHKLIWDQHKRESLKTLLLGLVADLGSAEERKGRLNAQGGVSAADVGSVERRKGLENAQPSFSKNESR